jgi:hypothetical protein
MASQNISTIHVDRDRFLQQVVAHHRRGDYYPDPGIIGQELQLTAIQTENVLLGLRTLRWIAESPYGPDRLRLTPRCWTFLLRLSEQPTITTFLGNEDACTLPWQAMATEPYCVR